MRVPTLALCALVALTPAACTSSSPTSSDPPSTSVATATATEAATEVWRPALRTSWHWMIAHPLDLADPKDMGLVAPDGSPLPASVAPPSVYDIDGEYNPASTVAALHAKGARVICYVDVGVYEDYRSDRARFPASVIGRPDSHWEGSRWLDIRRRDVLLPIMRDRFQRCKDKGFDAIEPDEIDGYGNDTGFPLTAADQLAYNRAIADLAHSMGMSIGLKGDVAQAADLWRWFDWTLNEQCFEFDECDDLATSFVANGKAVFQVEYDDRYSGHRADPATFCEEAESLGFNSMKMPLELDGGRLPCR